MEDRMIMGERSKCGRWNPTAEQVKILTELFRSGLRTPTTNQIQNISSQLSFYGKIESKNVFYWFQNHKARERHKIPKLSFHHTHHLTNNIPPQNSLITSSSSSSQSKYNIYPLYICVCEYVCSSLMGIGSNERS